MRIPGGPEEGQGEGQEDQEEVKELMWTPWLALAALRSPGPPGLAHGAPLEPLKLPPASLFEGVL